MHTVQAHRERRTLAGGARAGAPSSPRLQGWLDDESEGMTLDPLRSRLIQLQSIVGPARQSWWGPALPRRESETESRRESETESRHQSAPAPATADGSKARAGETVTCKLQDLPALPIHRSPAQVPRVGIAVQA